MYFKTLTAALLGAALFVPMAQAQTIYPLTI